MRIGGDPDWLGETAADMMTGLNHAGVEQAIAGLPVDFALQAAIGRKKALFVADMDSTIIGCECLDELADFAGLKDQIAAITERAMRGGRLRLT